MADSRHSILSETLPAEQRAAVRDFFQHPAAPLYKAVLQELRELSVNQCLQSQAWEEVLRLQGEVRLLDRVIGLPEQLTAGTVRRPGT